MSLHEVHIIISSQLTGDTYLARSYPDDDFDNNGKKELYKTPVYKVFIEGRSSRKEWKALRFMPYYNDPKAPSGNYKTKGWANSGKWQVPKKRVTLYDPFYSPHNTFSPYSGAIQIEGNFLIHAGPLSIHDSGWGAAGCVEIIGDFGKFKEDIKNLSGSLKKTASDAITELVRNGKLFLQVDYAYPPDLKKNFSHEY